MQKLLTLFTLLLLPGTALGFTENPTAPTQNNAPIPLNTSSNTQVKSGAFVSDSYMQADVFYDRYNAGYYLQPRGTNRLNYIVADNTLTYGNSDVNGESRAALFRDRFDGNFYVDPNGWTVLNLMQVSRIWDRDNTGYNLDLDNSSYFNALNSNNSYAYTFWDRNNTAFYMDPSGNSRVSAIYADYLYSYGVVDTQDVYLRSIGRWASSLGGTSFQYRMVSVPEGSSINQCPAGFTAVS